MSEDHCDDLKPPVCPVCGAETRLKERHRNHRITGDTCVFKCIACGVEYPVIVPAH